MEKNWYFWTDPEHCRGPFGSRDEAIAEGIDENLGGVFEIAIGHPMKYQAPNFDRIAEDFDDLNSEYSGEDYASEKWSDEHYTELKRELVECFDAWLDRHNYRQAWALDLGPSETIIGVQQ